MIPFQEPKKLASIIMGKHKMHDLGTDEPESDLDVIAEELIHAIHTKDKDVFDALYRAFADFGEI